MKVLLMGLICFFGIISLSAQEKNIKIKRYSDGFTLTIDEEPFMINGMNWDYFPVGTTVTYSLWNQSDDLIKAALDREMSMLQNMGVNVIRQYVGIQPRWITYIYEKYGIYTMLNHAFGRYGLTLNGRWVPNTEYADPLTQQLLLSEVRKLAEEYKDTPGLIMYLLGNENNYGLFWDGAETEDIPIEDRKSTVRARAMYKLFNEAAIIMKEVDQSHPVAMCNGDLLFIEIIAEECKDIDIYGTNMYRGISFGDAFQRVQELLDKPFVFTEFGADAFNVLENSEDQKSQAYYMVGNWKEIYENAAGNGLVGNSIGGFTFQFSDGWWKYGQTTNLDIHDTNASWGNGGYQNDFEEGEDNMNEEWFGVCAKGPTNERGLYYLYPRAAYYALKKAHQIDPYISSLDEIQTYFENINIMEAVIEARGDKAAMIGEQVNKVRLSGLRAELTTFNTGGSLISTPKDAVPGAQNYPDELGFDHMQSFFVDVEANPAPNVRADISFNVLGRVAENPINEIFYENRGRVQSVNTNNGDLALSSINRLAVYRGDFEWNSKYFNLDGFYRTGHYQWGYEGDFFGLYPEANYGQNIDIYNGIAPFGVEMEGKKSLEGLKLAFGPELWWGANPAVLVKYRKSFKGFDITGIFHEDLDAQNSTVSSFAIPQLVNRRASLHIAKSFGQLGLELGGIWSGQPRNGETFQLVDLDGEGDYTVYQDQIKPSDNWGGKARITYSAGPVNWYAQGAAMGVVALGGADYTKMYTGWRLKDSGSGNQFNFLTGFTYLVGDFQIAPNFLWQKPIIGPIPGDVSAPGVPRNILDDPFAVRANRETVGGEILFTFDPTPGTWMYEWDNDMAEDAAFAMSAGLIYRHQPTTQDAAIGILADGRSLITFPGAPPAQDLWEVSARMVSKVSRDFGLIAYLYTGNAQANGSDPRLIHRGGGNLRLIYKKYKLSTEVKVDDWGPFDYHRDFNLTYPLQLMADVSTNISKPSWWNHLPDTRMGLQYTWRSLNEFSPRYCPTQAIDAAGNIVCDPTAIGFENGTEWEFRTYFMINIGM
ncbi:glycoside hydrolase family 2 TIM barrel-domain containing protein [Portibacter marinus]|uniref:glycoside hydrolase family 2 TIM barrel-domain containing protein n=1 Tax=Portibacter marinus TaxID=2898660 RepID=UPI001F3FED72|nr:glycoside hydrolase family 2 TIM barrel-domain containing protein [Portibacter marinus]